MARILIVDDAAMITTLASSVLTQAGHEVAVRNEVLGTSSFAMQFAPDLILMDMGLPTLDGWEATRHLKADPQTCQIPIIALTAHAIAGDREKCLEAGCDDYDTKPVNLERLLSKMEALLENRHEG
jgi:CheY-like chemotaxis protein